MKGVEVGCQLQPRSRWSGEVEMIKICSSGTMNASVVMKTHSSVTVSLILLLELRGNYI